MRVQPVTLDSSSDNQLLVDYVTSNPVERMILKRLHSVTCPSARSRVGRIWILLFGRMTQTPAFCLSAAPGFSVVLDLKTGLSLCSARPQYSVFVPASGALHIDEKFCNWIRITTNSTNEIYIWHLLVLQYWNLFFGQGWIQDATSTKIKTQVLQSKSSTFPAWKDPSGE